MKVWLAATPCSSRLRILKRPSKSSRPRSGWISMRRMNNSPLSAPELQTLMPSARRAGDGSISRLR